MQLIFYDSSLKSGPAKFCQLPDKGCQLVRDQLGLNFHAELLENFQLKISDDYLFALDNPYSRYNNASTASLAKFQKRLLRDFEETHETLDEMFALLKTLKPAVTIKFGEFHEVSQNIRDSFVNLQVHYANIR